MSDMPEAARTLPNLGPRYWSALSLASIFGCNTGDVLADDAGLGHWRGLPVLALAFALTLFTANRRRPPGEAWYWLAIIIVRTAATNLADLLVHDLRTPYPVAFALLAAILVAVGAVTARRARAGTLPPADLAFWTGMFAAGTLGTAAGDGLAFARGLGLPAAAAATCLACAAALGLRAVPNLRTAATFWIAVTAIRTAGTNLGDLFAHRLTLEASTVATGAAFAALLVLWSPPAAQASQPLAQPR